MLVYSWYSGILVECLYKGSIFKTKDLSTLIINALIVFYKYFIQTLSMHF